MQFRRGPADQDAAVRRASPRSGSVSRDCSTSTCCPASSASTRSASTEAILARFTRSASHQAMPEIGRAQRTPFVARYLRERDLQREIEEGLNMVDSWNAGNVVYYSKGGEISTDRREEVEMGALCRRILQASPVYVNTFMLQNVLAEPEWADRLTRADRRGLTSLLRTHIRPYGEVRLDPGARLAIGVTDSP
ncbi:Tn3 family transposase [Spirillospora sp. CA-128828]|uniref:Tn3 family transposase n=1 Tax=Spirillospora sp. CA-128828 TaxID=3240033 RepID=UPI003D8ACA16